MTGCEMDPSAYETIKMEDVLDPEHDWFENRASFRAVVDKHWPDCSTAISEEPYPHCSTSSSISSSSWSSAMQLDQGSSSPGTSSPGICTPPSTPDTQGDPQSPDVAYDSIPSTQNVAGPDMFGHMGPSAADFESLVPGQILDIEMSDQNPLGLYDNGAVAAQQYTVDQLARQSPLPYYVWGFPPGSYPQGGVSIDQAAIGLGEANTLHAGLSQSSSSPAQVCTNPATFGSASPFEAFSGQYSSTSMIWMTQHNVHQESSPLPPRPNNLAYRPHAATMDTTQPVEGSHNLQGLTRQSRQPRLLLRAEPPSRRQTTGTTSPVEASGSQSPKCINRGGRKKGLDIEARERANEMRKVGVCWICAIARDKCDPGRPCGRCAFRSQRGQSHLLSCVRIHLQELVIKFLPATMNRQHRRDETVKFVQQNLGYWRGGSPLQVCLTSHGLGYFTWDLHEFEPASQELLFQRRYLIGANGKWQALQKRSPPLALKEVNYTQTHKLETYVENILDRYLDKFRRECYEEEEECTALFQSDVLGALCDLYTALPEEESDKNLKGDLRQVLKMIVLTYIMDHAVTIFPAYQSHVISKMQNYNDPAAYQDWTSPMMANRQFKYFFSDMQTQQYTKSLNRLHQILRTANNKGKQWMSSFVLILGISLVLEQCQHLLWLKADNSVAKFECSANDATFQARRDCTAIDDSFDFLCKLYHCKYRGKHRQRTRFEEWSSQTSNAAEAEFTRRIYDIVDRNGGYLLQRLSLQPIGIADNNFASRLAARFLVELMGLDRGSP